MPTSKEGKNVIGADTNSEYIAYGDDSKVDDYIIYAFVIIRSSDISSFEQKVIDAKLFYEVPGNIPIHCSVLLSGDKRKKIGIGHLSSDKILLLFRRIIRMFNQLPICLTYTFCNYTKYKDNFQKNNLNPISNESQLPKITVTDYKGILGMMANLCINAQHKDPQIPKGHECEIIVSSDRTPTFFAGNERRQAHNWIEMPIHVNNSDKNDPHLVQPLVLESKDSIMLQVADVAAYMCVQAKSDRRNAKFFRKLLNKIKHQTESEFFWNP